jgi:hypothetical protein
MQCRARPTAAATPSRAPRRDPARQWARFVDSGFRPRRCWPSRYPRCPPSASAGSRGGSGGTSRVHHDAGLPPHVVAPLRVGRHVVERRQVCGHPVRPVRLPRAHPRQPRVLPRARVYSGRGAPGRPDSSGGWNAPPPALSPSASARAALAWKPRPSLKNYAQNLAGSSGRRNDIPSLARRSCCGPGCC